MPILPVIHHGEFIPTDSWRWPIAYSAALIGPHEAPCIKNIPFDVWLQWRARVQIPPEQPQDYALAQVQTAIAGLPQ